MKNKDFSLSEFNYNIPVSLIAQEPVSPRDNSRLLIVDRKKEEFREMVFRDIGDFFQKGDVIVLNDTKVINARLLGRKNNGGRVDVLLINEIEEGIWDVLVKPGKRARVGDTVIFNDGEFTPLDSKHLTGFTAKIIDKTPRGGRILQFSPKEIKSSLNYVGKVPLPNYIKKEIDDSQKYQTVYAQKEGAIAAPTAGLHFTERLLLELKQKGINIVYITLHCGLATFRPVKTEDIRSHAMESEWVELPFLTAEVVNKAKKEAKKIVAVGTTSIRTLESAVCWDEKDLYYIKSFCGYVNLYIVPGYKFKIADAVITNFHTPCSTNLILMSAFCGKDLLKKSYDYAIKNNFRFFSFGDAMMII